MTAALVFGEQNGTRVEVKGEREKKEREGEGGGERGEGKKEIARREARTWQATDAGRAQRDLRRRGQRGGEERGGEEVKDRKSVV